MSEPSTSMLNNATIEKAEKNEISNIARDMFKFVQNNYNVNIEELSDVIKHFLNVIPHLLAEAHRNDHSRSTASETTGANGGGSDSLPQPVSICTPQSSISSVPGLVNISNMVPASPSSLPVTSIADRYTCSMLKCLAGYPLYEPEPFSELSTEYLRRGVNIGDVGFVRGDGTFDFLFNICPSQNDSINPRKLPEGFSLEISECLATRPIKPYPRETHLFTNPAIRTKSGEYICQGSEGAILELPEGAIHDEALNMLPFENLAARHGVEWYKYTMSRGRAIPNGSLYLITSVTKCTQWGIAIFDQPCASGEGLRFDNETSLPFLFRKSTPKYRWKGPNTSNTKVANRNQGNAPNQCVFLRGYKIMIRQDTFDNLRKEQRRGSRTGRTAVPSSSSPAGSSSPTRQKASRIRGGVGTDPALTGRNLFTQTTKSAVMQSDEVVLHANFNSSLIHPSDLVNAALLSQNPSAKIALTHDDVWCNLLRDNFPKFNYATLIKIARSYTCMIDKYGCVSLVKISDSSNFLDGSSRPVRGTKTPSLQEPIQGSKDEHLPAQGSSTLRPQYVDRSLGTGDEGNPGISIPSEAPFTRHRSTKNKREKMKASTVRSFEALDRQESHTSYQQRINPRDSASKMAAVFRRVRSFTISDRRSLPNISTVNQQSNLRKREEELEDEERKLKDRIKEIRKKEEEVRKWKEEARLIEDEANVKALEARKREREILRREAEAKQMESKARRKELAVEEEVRRMKEEARRWEEEMEKKEEEIERRKEEALHLAEEMRQKADEVKRREEELMAREEELERRELESRLEKETQQLQEKQRQREHERQRQFEQYLSLILILLPLLFLLLSIYGYSHSILTNVMGLLRGGTMPQTPFISSPPLPSGPPPSLLLHPKSPSFLPLPSIPSILLPGILPPRPAPPLLLHLESPRLPPPPPLIRPPRPAPPLLLHLESPRLPPPPPLIRPPRPAPPLLLHLESPRLPPPPPLIRPKPPCLPPPPLLLHLEPPRLPLPPPLFRPKPLPLFFSPSSSPSSEWKDMHVYY